MKLKTKTQWSASLLGSEGRQSLDSLRTALSNTSHVREMIPEATSMMCEGRGLDTQKSVKPKKRVDETSTDAPEQADYTKNEENKSEDSEDQKMNIVKATKEGFC